MTKSRIETCPTGNIMATDEEWFKITFDKEEFLEALKNNRVETLVRNVLFPKYCEYRCFDILVADTVKSLMKSVVSKLSTIESIKYSTGSVVLVRSSRIDRLEEQVTNFYKETPEIRLQQNEVPNYWIGEEIKISDR